MNFSEDILQHIEDYLNGNLNAEEAKAFENQIKENTDLAEAVAINKKMRLHYSEADWDLIKYDKNLDKVNDLELLLKSEDFQDKKKAIQSASHTYFNSVKPKKTKSKSVLYIVLGIAASLVLFFGIFLKDNAQTNLEIYSDYSNWDELPSLVSRGETDEVLLSKGENAFINKDYKLASETFKTYLDNESKINLNALLYSGISQLELNNYASALDDFDKIISSSTLDQSKGYWYKALTYLKMDDRKNAIKTLEVIVKNKENFNYTKAEKLLKALKN